MSRKSLTILATVMISFLAAGAAFAQDDGDAGMDRAHDGERGKGMPRRGQRGPMDPERVISMMTRRLELDETQAEQVRNIYLAAQPEFESIREQGRTIRTAMRDLDSEASDYEVQKQNLSAEREGIAATSKELRDRIRSEIDVVLTDEQREKVAAAEESRRDRGQRKRRRGQADPEA